MATVTDWTTLLARVARTIRRSDLTDDIPAWVQFCENEINRALRVAGKTARATSSITTEFWSLPGDFGGVRTMSILTNPPTPLEFRSADQLAQEKQINPANGIPKFYGISGDKFEFVPAPDGTYSAALTYDQDIPALSATNTTNWLITKHPDAYFYGTLLHSAPFLKNDDRIPMWGEFFRTILEQITAQDERSNYGTPLTMRRRIPS